MGYCKGQRYGKGGVLTGRPRRRLPSSLPFAPSLAQVGDGAGDGRALELRLVALEQRRRHLLTRAGGTGGSELWYGPARGAPGVGEDVPRRTAGCGGASGMPQR